MLLDGHIHLREPEGDRKAFRRRLKQAGVDGGLLVSLPPGWRCDASRAERCRRRLESLRFWAEAAPRLYPFYWIDPVAEDAADQVGLALERDVAGFKVICSHHYPGDERALPVYAAIAAARKPILFHSGILWDGRPSAQYNRPGNFEELMEVAGLRFSLAHLSWPWCDECLAVYGKFQHARTVRPEMSAELYLDLTPGTPPVYRREALTKLFTIGYDVECNAIFGSDSNASDYNAEWVKQWVKRDEEIYAELELSAEARAGVFGENLLRFIGERPVAGKGKPLRVGA